MTVAVAARHPVAGALERWGVAGAPKDLYLDGAACYDALVRDDLSEVAEVLRLVRCCSSPVVDLGAGSGRITLPLLAAGCDTVAVDTSAAMLDVLAARVASSPGLRGRLLTHTGDMATFEPGAPIGLFVCGTTTICLLGADDRRRTFAMIRRHLAPGGRFAFSFLDVDTAWGDRQSAMVVPVESESWRGLDLLLEQLDLDARTRSVTVVHQRLDPLGPPELFTSTSTLLDHATLAVELASCGLDVVDEAVVSRSDDRRTVLMTCAAAPCGPSVKPGRRVEPGGRVEPGR